MSSSTIAITVLCLAIAISLANAYPFGAGSCPAGTAAVGGPHKAGSSAFASGGLTVTLDSTTLTPGSPARFLVGQDHVLTVSSTSSFKGILLRLGSPNGVSTGTALSVKNGDSTLQIAGICDGVGGVTHTANSGKTSASVILRLNSVATNLALDITVVASISSSFYNGFTLNAVTASTPTGPPPTTTAVAPTPRPISPTTRPVASSPVKSTPIRSPVSSPVSLSSLVRRPLRRPTRRPTVPTRRQPARFPSRPTTEDRSVSFPSRPSSRSPASFPARPSSGDDRE